MQRQIDANGNVAVGKVLVTAAWKEISAEWAELAVSIYIHGEEHNFTHPDHPLLVARRYSGSNLDVEVPELSVLSVVHKLLGAKGAVVFSVQADKESFNHDPSAGRYAYWCLLGGRTTFALQTTPSATVQVVGL